MAELLKFRSAYFAMALRTNRSSFLAAFLIAFVCLNAAGAACVAYCRALGEPEAVAAEKQHHCGMLKIAADDESNSIDESRFDCCPLAIGFVAGPRELRQSISKPLLTASIEDTRFEVLPIVSSNDRHNAKTYRGPPIDRRADRIKHCILRI